MKQIFLATMVLAFAGWSHAGTCPETCRDICGTQKSCCPAQGKSCGSKQLERGGNPASAYSSKGGLRLR